MTTANPTAAPLAARLRRLQPLFLREWLQHRFGWAMIVLIPFGLAVLVTSLGRFNVETDDVPHQVPPVVLAFVTQMGAATVTTLLLVVTSLIFVGGLARRDHGDRSVEYWLSLPTGHSASFGVPLVVHLLLVPIGGLLVGLAAGVLLSFVVVTRMAGAEAWFGLPWGGLLLAMLAFVGRMAAGLPLALLWVLPFVLLLVLLNAWFRRWGLIVLAAGAVGLAVLEQYTPLRLSPLLAELWRNAGLSLISGDDLTIDGRNAADMVQTLKSFPALAWSDYAAALGRLISPLLLGGLLVSAGLFALLVDWRRRGAGTAG
jgi:ABC-2 type transport system permease protein